MILGGAHITEWLTAIGTIGAVIVSLFYSPIRKIFCRPKIEVDFQNKMPWIETKEVSNQSSSQDKRVLIRVRVTNIGKSVANDANLDVDAIFEKRDKSDVYVCSKSFMPIHIKDYRNASPTRIVPHLVYYLDIASIEKYDGMTEEGGNGIKKQFYKLFLLGEGTNNMMLGRGTFIIPLKFYSSNTKVMMKYLQIYWESDNFTQDKRFFDVKLLSSKQFDKLKKE